MYTSRLSPSGLEHTMYIHVQSDTRTHAHARTLRHSHVNAIALPPFLGCVMTSPLLPPQSCAHAVVEDEDMTEDESRRVCQAPSTADNQPRSMDRDFDFVERPSQDFFCPVSLELLLEPQLTSCCGHHLSLEAATRLQREGKPCPMCNDEQWQYMLDKFHKRKVHVVRVRCWYKDNGCEWVGEVNELKRHADSCMKRPWECKYCGMKCTYGEGEGKHWPTCLKFPEPCPNGCEVGNVERCNVEQHRSVCSLEPVACEMKEFGCSVVVPRKELATHMRESELQHLTAMTVLNLRLSRQLQQDSTERDKKIAQLQQEMIDQKKLQTDMQAEMKMKMDEQQAETVAKIDEQAHTAAIIIDEQKQIQAEQKRELTELKDHIQKVEHTAHHIEQHTAGGACSICEVFTFTQYGVRKYCDEVVNGDPFYSCGYKFQLRIHYYSSRYSDIGVFLELMKGEYVDHLHWPVEVKVRLELLNQAGDHHHVVRTKNIEWMDKRDGVAMDSSLMKYSDLERQGDGVQYMMNDCLKFRTHVTVLPA